MMERSITLFFLLGSMVYIWEANKLAFGSLLSPKSGFLPVLAGLTAIGLSAAILMKQCKEKTAKRAAKTDWMKFSFIIIGLLFYVTLLNVIGYFVTTFIFMIYLCKVADVAGWLTPLLIGAGVAMSLYLVFEQFLAVTLP